MSVKAYTLMMRIIAFALAAVIAVSVIREWTLLVPLASIMVALSIATLLRRTVKEVMADERSRRIDEKAASMSYRIFVIATAVFVLVVLMLRASLPSALAAAGQTLAYAVCGLMLLHLFFTRYYDKKL